MRVLLDGLQAGNRSGTGRYASALMRMLPEIDPETAWAAALPGSEVPPDVRIGTVYPSSTARAPIGTVLRSWQFGSRIKAFRPDIIHYPANFCRWVGRGSARNAKVVLTVHDLTFLREPAWFKRDRAAYYRSMIGRSVRTANRILADSEATAADLREILGVPGAKIDVVLLGVDFDTGTPDTIADREVCKRLELNRDYFLYLGTIEPRKNLPRVIEAFDRIADDVGLDLVIAGRPGWRYDATFESVERAKHRDRIRRIGFVADEDAPAVLRRATAFVWPSLWEGFGLPPLEAMVHGVPVLTSNTSSLPEVVGDAALTVNPEDVDAIANAMRQLASDAALRDRLRAAGRKRAAELSWEKTARETVAAYRRVLDGA